LIKPRARAGDSLLKIKRDFIVGMLVSSSSTGRRKEPVAVFLAMGLSHELMTQEEVMEVTWYGRSTISETLTRLTGLGVVNVEKKTRDRKKYYSAFMGFQNYGLQKSQRQKGGYSEIIDMIGRRFLPRLREVESDPEEKERVKAFLEANIRAYQLIVDYVTLLFDTFQEWMKDIQWPPNK
jgi:DNA-binding transcriptional regulator GbsR (MarR family)